MGRPTIYPKRCLLCSTEYMNKNSFHAHKKKGVCARRIRETNSNVELTKSIIHVAKPSATTRSEYLDKCNTFYIVQTPHSFNCGLNVYKIGQTINMNNRKGGYPKGSIVILQLLCRDALFFEQHVKNLLLNAEAGEIRQRKDFGNEFFEGALDNIMDAVMQAYKRTGMSPAHVSDEPVDIDQIGKPDIGKTKEIDALEKEYQKMLFEKKIDAIKKHKLQRKEELSDDLVNLFERLTADDV